MLKATKVDGIYDKDPVKHEDANLQPDITYDEVHTDTSADRTLCVVRAFLAVNGNFPCCWLAHPSLARIEQPATVGGVQLRSAFNAHCTVVMNAFFKLYNFLGSNISLDAAMAALSVLWDVGER